ncbi:ABC transporter permease [Virgibacillus ainsalahensis]
MNKFWIILSHTYLNKVKSKTFIITTALMLLLVVGAVNFQSIMGFFSDDSKDQIAVIDETDTLFAPLKENIESVNEEMELVAFNESEESGKNAVQDDTYAALITLSLNEEELPEAAYFANDITDAEQQQVIQEQLQRLKVGMAIERAGVDQEAIAAINQPVQFDAVALDEGAKTMEEMFQAQGVVYVMVFLMYMVVIMYGTMIATDVATEKSSRVMEILISSASPVAHMFAKIIGIALVGLTQIGLFIGLGAGMIAMQRDELVGGMLDTFGFLDAPVSLIIFGIVFFLLGYLLYATLAAMFGSLVNRSEEANQAVTPLILLLVVAFLIAMSGLAAPQTSLVTITSFIPFFTPMVMLLRVGMLDVPLWEVALSIGLLIGTIIVLGLIGARVYKGGVLMYGGSNPLKDIKKAMALSKKE